MATPLSAYLSQNPLPGTSLAQANNPLAPRMAMPSQDLGLQEVAGKYYDTEKLQNYVRERAPAFGIDPNVALRVHKAEGGSGDIWQSGITKVQGDGRKTQEPSFGPWQFLVGDGKDYPKGMGNDFQAQTGLDPRDPANVFKMTDFALGHASKNGWGSWYGARDNGIGNFEGIGGKRAPGTTLTSAPVGSAPPARPGPTLEAAAALNTAAPAMAALPVDGGALPTGEKPSVWDQLKAGDWKGAAATASENPAVKKGTDAVQAASKQDEGASRIDPTSLGSLAGIDASRAQGAQQLMATLLASRKKRSVPGLSLMG